MWFDDQIKTKRHKAWNKRTKHVVVVLEEANTQIQAHKAPPSLDIAVAEGTKKEKKAPIEAKLAALSLSLAAAEAKHHIHQARSPKHRQLVTAAEPPKKERKKPTILAH